MNNELDNYNKQRKTVQDMELRDFFAALAMNGMASGEDIRGNEPEVAKVAYVMADEMIKRRKANKEAVMRGHLAPAQGLADWPGLDPRDDTAEKDRRTWAPTKRGQHDV